MLKVNIIYLTVVSVIAINSLALAEDSEDISPQGKSVRVIEEKPLASTEEEALGKSSSPDLLKGIGNTEDLIKEGISGSIPASKIEEALKSPDKTFTEDGRTYKILNENFPEGFIHDMAESGKSISGKIQQTLGPNGIGWRFSYDNPSMYDERGELSWTKYPNYGPSIDFQVEDITPHPPSSAWYEFWK